MSLMPSWTWGDLDLTASPFLFGFGSDSGTPATATEALAQLLEDGEIEVSPRASNRTLGFTIYVESSDLLANAEAERLLAIEADRERNTLTYDPGDGFAPVTVYDTFRAQLTFVRDDDAEANNLRRYDVTMKAAPFGRSNAAVRAQAVVQVAVPTVTTINAGDTVTDWSSRRFPPIDNGTYLSVQDDATYTPPSAVDLSTTRYVSLVMWGGTGSPTLVLNGSVPTELAGMVPTGIPGQTRYYWLVPASTSATVFAFTYGSSAGFSFNSLQRTDSLLALGTTRQKQRTVAIEGSARTQGSLAISHSTSALGSTLVYTWPGGRAPGYSPCLRPRRVSGGSVTTDSALVSGSSDMLDTALVFDVPVLSLIAGTHLLMARVKSDTIGAQVINYTAQTRQGSTNISSATSGSLAVPFGSTAWRNVVLGRLMLPPTGVPDGSTAVVRVTIVAAVPAASNIDLDEAWLFNTSVGNLTWVECGSGSPSAGGSANRLWLDTATTDVPRPAIYQGFSGDRSDAFYPGADVLSFGVHTLTLPMMNVFTVTSNALNASVALDHFPHWHTHAAS